MTERAHGTRTKYVNDGCRCFACKVANANQESARAARRRARAPWRVHHVQETGGWIVRNQLTGEIGWRGGPEEHTAAYETRESLNTYEARESETPPLWATEATLRAVKRHLRRLQAAGIGLRRVAQLAGLSRTRLTEIVNSASYNADRPRKRWLKHATAERILAVLPSEAKPAPAAVIPAKETWRLIDELLAAGAKKVDVARALGYRSGYGLLNRRERVLQRSEDAVRAVHDAMYRASSRLRAVCRCPEWRR